MLSGRLACALLLATCVACSRGTAVPVDPDAAPTGPTTLSILVTDGAGGPFLPAKVFLTGEDGNRLRIGTLDMYNGAAQDIGYCELAAGVVGTYEGIILIDGTGEIPIADDNCAPTPAIPYGNYHLKVVHGIDFEMFETTVSLQPNIGRVVVNAPLERVWTADGTLAADLHVHAVESYDSKVPAWVRVVSELVTGMQVIGASDHNYNGSFDLIIDDLKLRGKIASVPGNEVSVDMIHSNVFPAVMDSSKPANGAPSFDAMKPLTAQQLFAQLRALPGGPLIQVNHPRLRYAAYFDYAGWNGDSWPPPMPIDFDAIEVLNGMSAFNKAGDMRVERSLQDLYTFMKNGRVVAATGNSDTHHLSSVLAGVPRNYVFTDGKLDPFDPGAFVDAVRNRRIVVTTGPWLDVKTGDGARAGQLASAEGGNVHLDVSVKQASFIKANRLRVWVGGELFATVTIPDGSRAFTWSGDLPIGASDSWIGVDVMGDELLPTELTGDFLYWTQQSGVAPVAFINPILVDANGDGQYTAPVVAGRARAVPDLLPPPAGDRHQPYECGVPPPK